MNKWQIKDLKGVGDVELNLDSNQRVFTFLGTNGVGKTKTLEVLSLYILPFIENCSNYPILDKIHNFANSQRKVIDFNGNFNFQAWAYLGANKRSHISQISEIDTLD